MMAPVFLCVKAFYASSSSFFFFLFFLHVFFYFYFWFLASLDSPFFFADPN